MEVLRATLLPSDHRIARATLKIPNCPNPRNKYNSKPTTNQKYIILIHKYQEAIQTMKVEIDKIKEKVIKNVQE